jgi:hypothetical protein
MHSVCTQECQLKGLGVQISGRGLAQCAQGPGFDPQHARKQNRTKEKQECKLHEGGHFAYSAHCYVSSIYSYANREHTISITYMNY